MSSPDFGILKGVTVNSMKDRTLDSRNTQLNMSCPREVSSNWSVRAILANSGSPKKCQEQLSIDTKFRVL